MSRFRLLLGPRGPSVAAIASGVLRSMQRNSGGNFTPTLVDIHGNYITGTDNVLSVAVPNGADGNVVHPLSATRRSGCLVYGQSNAVAKYSTPVLTPASAYAAVHKTFIDGVFSSAPGNTYGGLTSGLGGTTASKALGEDGIGMFHTVYPVGHAQAGQSDSGESRVTGAIDELTRLAIANDAIAAANNPWFGSAPGKSGIEIDGLEVDSSWWDAVFLNHLKQQYALSIAALETYALRWLIYAQGEADAILLRGYHQHLDSLINGIAHPANDAGRAVTGQTESVFTQLFQTPFRAIENGGEVSLAQYDATTQSSLIDYVANDIIFPHVDDALHFSNVGTVLRSRYAGRAGYWRFVKGVEPPFLKPISASYASGVITIQYDPPTAPVHILPLIADDAEEPTFQSGVRCFDSGSGNNALTNFRTSGSGTAILCDAARAPVGTAFIDIGKDYLAPGCVTNLGATHDIADSTPDTTTIEGVVYSMRHVSPICRLPLSY